MTELEQIEQAHNAIESERNAFIDDVVAVCKKWGAELICDFEAMEASNADLPEFCGGRQPTGWSWLVDVGDLEHAIRRDSAAASGGDLPPDDAWLAANGFDKKESPGGVTYWARGRCAWLYDRGFVFCAGDVPHIVTRAQIAAAAEVLAPLGLAG